MQTLQGAVMETRSRTADWQPRCAARVGNGLTLPLQDLYYSPFLDNSLALQSIGCAVLGSPGPPSCSIRDSLRA